VSAKGGLRFWFGLPSFGTVTDPNKLLVRPSSSLRFTGLDTSTTATAQRRLRRQNEGHEIPTRPVPRSGRSRRTEPRDLPRAGPGFNTRLNDDTAGGNRFR